MKRYLLHICMILLALCTLTGCSGEDGVPEPSFSREEYRKLLEFRFDGYEDMSISAYQEKAWRLLDQPEYFELIRRFSESETFYACRDKDEAAGFLFYVLEPVTAERWEKREFSGFTETDHTNSEDNAMLEFILTLMIQDKDQLTMGEYVDARTDMTGGLKKILQGRTKEQLQNQSFMQAEIDKEIDHLAEQWNSEKLKMQNTFKVIIQEGKKKRHHMISIFRRK